MNDIIPIITIAHTGTQTIVYQFDPIGADKLIELSENNELTIDEFRKTKYNYILLEYLSSNWSKFKDLGGTLISHTVIDNNRENIVYGHIVPHNRRTTFLDSLACIRELNEQYGILMTMRDPLLSIISTMIRDERKREDSKGLGISTDTFNERVGGPFAPMGEWIRNHMMPEILKHPRPADVSAAKALVPPQIQSIGGGSRAIHIKKSRSLKTLDDFLSDSGNTGRKDRIPGSEYIEASNYEIKGQLFMWDLWAKHIHKLKPFYVTMDLDNKQDLIYRGINFKDLKHHNATEHHPLKQAYYDRDLLYIAKELKDNMRALIDLESVLRPPLEELGYKDLLWWD